MAACVFVSSLLACTSTPMTTDAGSDAGPALGAIGAACTADADCQARLTCFTGAPGARPWPSGYCTRPCATEDCPTGSTCGEAYYDSTSNTEHYMCLATCNRASGSTGGCRGGYFCMLDGVCHVGCTSDAQCASVDYDLGAPRTRPGSTCEIASGRCIRGSATGGDTGAACTADADCRGPFGVCQNGRCLRSDCDLGGAYACSTGQECVSYIFDDLQSEPICALDCVIGTDGLAGHPGACGPGEACVPAAQDYSGRATHSFCYPTTGAQMTGSTTARVGSPCSTSADCPDPLGYGFCSNGSCLVSLCGVPELASMNLCGAGARCVTTHYDPMTATRFNEHDAQLGVCFRDCTSGASACQAPTTCQADHTCSQ
jgi:hypothetical protein